MKSKVLLISVSVLLVTVLIIGISYAVWLITETQVNSNVLATDCFDIEFTEEASSNINLQNTFPLTDEDAMDLVPYTFSVKNTCDLPVSYQINLEVFNTTTLDHSLIAGVVDNNVISVATDKDVVTSILENTTSYNYKTEVLKYNEVNNHEFRMWMDETATLDNSQNKLVEAKITIVAVPYSYDYDVVADLMNDTSLIEGDIVSTGGYYLLDDGGGSIYEIKTTGTANNMNIIELDNGLFAHLKMDEYIDEINVNQYGIKTNDESFSSVAAIQLAFNSGSKNILFNNGDTYYIDSNIYVNGSEDQTISYNGNGSKIYLTDEYVIPNWNGEWIFVIKGENIIFENFDIKSLQVNERDGLNGVAQIGIVQAKNVIIRNSSLEGPDARYKEDDSSYYLYHVGIDIYSGWSDVLIDNVDVKIENDASASMCVTIRDIFGQGGKNLVIQNSHFQKIYHDEIISIGPVASDTDLAVSIENILVQNNTFISKEGLNSSSNIALSMAGSTNQVDTLVKDVTYKNNTFDLDTTEILVKTNNKTENIVFENNDVTMSLGTGYDSGASTVRTIFYTSPSETENPTIVRNNTITVKMHDTKYLSSIATGLIQFESNTVVVEDDVDMLFNRLHKASNNIISVQGDVTELQRNSDTIINNTFNVNSFVVVNRYFGTDDALFIFDKLYQFNGNVINSQNDHTQGQSLYLVTGSKILDSADLEFNDNKVNVTNVNDSILDYEYNLQPQEPLPTIGEFTILLKNNTYPATFVNNYMSYGDVNNYLIS